MGFKGIAKLSKGFVLGCDQVLEFRGGKAPQSYNVVCKLVKLTHAVNQQTSAVTTVKTAILKQFQATPPPASVKVVEEICITCGGAHPYYQCLAADGNTFLELRDNIQGYVIAAAVNYNQGSGSLLSNTIANPKGELKAITTRSGIVLDGPCVPIPRPFINPEEDERVEETLTDQDLAEHTIKVPPPLVQKPKPPSQRNFVVHQRDHLHPNIPYPSRMYKQKQQEKDKKMLKALLSNKEKLLELANTPLNENCLAVILKKLPKKLGDPGKFLIPCGFSKLKCKALTDLGATINLMPLSVWKKLVARSWFYQRSPSPRHINPLSGITTSSSSPNHLLKEFADELALITFPPEYDDDLTFDIESDLKEIEYLLHHDPIKNIESSLKDPIDQSNLNDLIENLVDTMPEMFTDEHAPDYSSPSLYDEYDDDLLKLSPTLNMFMMILLTPRERKSKNKNEKKLAISHDSLILEDFDPPLYELSFFKEVPRSKILLSFSSENEEKNFKPWILTSKEVHSSLIPELSHQGYKVFKINQILKSLMKIFIFSHGEDSTSWIFLISTSTSLTNSSMGELGQAKRP
nr:hypothetical protein [Tanacetum cinerariifolium]